jgi:P-type conjugative transfer protein TrbJ
MMRQALLATIAVLPLLCPPSPAQAQVAVACVNCSSLFQQLKDSLTQVEQPATEAAQLQTSLNSYAQMVQSGLSLPMSVWSNVQGDIGMVRSLTNASSLLTGNSGSILSRLQSAQGYANQAAYLPSNVGQQFTMWQQTLANSNASLGRVAAVQQQQAIQYAAIQATANGHSQTAAGQTQAIQASNEQLSLIATELNTTQATLLAASQQSATRDEIAADRQAMRDQAMLRFSQYQPVPTTGSQGF